MTASSKVLHRWHAFGLLAADSRRPPAAGAAGDNPFPNPVCLRDNCSYGDSARGGSGQPAQFDLDVTFDLF